MQSAQNEDINEGSTRMHNFHLWLNILLYTVDSEEQAANANEITNIQEGK